MPPLSLLIKPASGSCNMRCRYCFYADETENRETPLMGWMSAETMRTIADQALANADGDLTFAFQGGEPTLVGVGFYQALSSYVNAHPNPRGVRVHYAFQTNGLLVDEAWCRWFAENRVLVGISLDGPKHLHDMYRVDTHGRGTFSRVMKAIRLMEQYGVDFNILTVVSGANARHGQQIYNFFKQENFGYQQYIECLDPIGERPGGHAYSLTPERYEGFLKSQFDAWYRDMKAGGYVYNRYFENLMMILAGQMPESCNLQGFCQPQWVIEANGNVYPCDFYALDEWCMGNILTHSFAEMEQRRREMGFIQASLRLPENCRNCRWMPLCRNGCRRNRQMENGVNYFCSAYSGFLEYAYPRLVAILNLLRQKAQG